VITVVMSTVTNATPEKITSGLDVCVANGFMNHVQNVVVSLRTNIFFAKIVSESKPMTDTSL